MNWNSKGYEIRPMKFMKDKNFLVQSNVRNYNSFDDVMISFSQYKFNPKLFDSSFHENNVVVALWHVKNLNQFVIIS